MTNEQIKQAANEYADKEWPFDGYCASSDSFAAGASWRINSVWRKPTAYGEELKAHVEVIAHCKSGYHFGKFNAVGSCHEYIGFVSVSGIEFAISDILEYAYLDDLLPDGKEDIK